MSNFSLRSKLFILTLGGAGFAMLVGGVNYLSMEKVVGGYSHVISVNIPSTAALGEMSLAYAQLRIAARSLGTEGIGRQESESAIAEASKLSSDFEAARKRYQKLNYAPGVAFGPGEETLFKQVGESWDAYKRLLDKAIALARTGRGDDRQKMLAILAKQEPEAGLEFNKASSSLEAYHLGQGKEWAAEAQAAEQSGRALSLGVIGLGILFGMTFGLLLSSSTIRQLTGSAKAMAVTGRQVGVASSSLLAASEQLASSAQEQAASVEETSASLEQISGMVASTLASSQDSLTLSEEVAKLVASANESMSQLNQSVGDIAESNHRVEKLAKLIEEIGEKIELIDEIVFQTRLLSFNASVEAERAGEHGRGFAVVAQEIGNLAQMSGKSAAEINHIVKSSIKEAQDVAQTNRDNVGRGVSLCGEATERLASISAASGSILTGSQGILRASEEQNAGVRQINQAIQQISQATQSNASAAEQCSTGSRALAEQVQSLAGIVGGLETLVWGKAFDHSASEGNAADRLSREGHGRTGRAAPGGERAGAAVVPLRRAPAPAQKFAAASDKDQARDNAASAPDEMWEKM